MEKQRKKKGNGGALCKCIGLDAFYGPASEWLTRGLEQSCQISRQSHTLYVAKKATQKFEVPVSIHSDYCGTLHPARFSKISNPVISRTAEQPIAPKILHRNHTRRLLV